MVGLEQLERFLDHAQGAIARAFLGFCGEEGQIAPVSHHFAHVLLAPAVGTAVDGRGVDVVDAQVERAIDDGHGDVEVVRLLEGGLATERENPNFVAGLAQVARGHGVGRDRVRGKRGAMRAIVAATRLVPEPSGAVAAAALAVFFKNSRRPCPRVEICLRSLIFPPRWSR